jgi:multiple sugar transport system substrate-binding protein
MCYELKKKGYDTPFLPLWFTEWSGIPWGFYGEVLARGGKLADWKTHEPLVTVNGPAGDTLRAWKKLWNDEIIPHELLFTAEADYLEIWGSGRYIFGLREMYDLKRYNDPRYSKFAGKCSVIPQGDGKGWSLLTGASYIMSKRPRSEEHTRDVMAVASWMGYKDQYDKVRVYNKWIAESMFMPVYKSQTKDPEMKQLYIDSLARPEDYEVCLEISENTLSPIGVDNVVWSSEFNTWLKELLQNFLVEDKSVDATIKAIRDKISELNKQYGVR